MVRPLAGAGIEINDDNAIGINHDVRPLAGAGIEIDIAAVRPLAGAGIEMCQLG